jgi:hypothetical protein
MKSGTKAHSHKGTKGNTSTVNSFPQSPAFSLTSCLRAFVPSCLAIILLTGCTYNSNNTTPDAADRQQKQQAALNDPMNYKSDEGTQSYDISGGGINNFDSNAMKRDLDDVLNP